MKFPPILKSPFTNSTGPLGNVSTGFNLGREWVEDHSPILMSLRAKLSEKRPFEGLTIGVCLPGTWEAFMYLSTLEFGGASLLFYPMSCRTDVGSELSKMGSLKVVKNDDLTKMVNSCNFIHDSTAFLGKILINHETSVKGIIEQTASGTIVYREMDRKGLLHQPVFDLDMSQIKRVGENKLATGLGLVEALLKLHIFLPTKRVLILGYGSVGEGCALYLSRLGCKVSIYDVDKNRIAEASASGYEVGDLKQILPKADIVVNSTGSLTSVLGGRDLENLKCGGILVNMGGNGWDRQFFENKRNVDVGDWIKKIFITDSKYIYELARGNVINFVLASGTDTETMDTVFSLSVLALEYLVENHGSMSATLQPIPDEIQRKHLGLVAESSERTDCLA